MKFAVATPAYGETVYTPYVRSLIRLQRALLKRGHAMSYMTVSFAEVSEARNFLVTHWFDKTDASHLLFVDADMGFEPQLVLDMLALNQPLVGAIYTRRQVDLARIAGAAKKGDTPERAIARGHDFILRALPGGAGAAKRSKGFMQVAGCGAGLMLISRGCIATMLKKLPAIEDRQAQKFSPLAKDLDRLIRAFDPLTVNGARLSEDFAFCHRWQKQCGGEIWARYDQALMHIGPHHFAASYADAGAGQRVKVVSKPMTIARGEDGLTVKEGKGPKVIRGRLQMPGKSGTLVPRKNGGKPVRN